jgi:hypothetical protein
MIDCGEINGAQDTIWHIGGPRNLQEVTALANAVKCLGRRDGRRRGGECVALHGQEVLSGCPIKESILYTK